MTSVLPSQPNLEQLKKQAKDVLSAHHDRSPGCCPVLRHLNRFKDSTDQEIFAAALKLSDVQFALAMEYGFTNWEELAQHLKDRGLGLSGDSARALARLRKHGVLAKLIGGEPKSITGGHGGPFAILEVEGPGGRFVVHEASDESGSRVQRQKRMGEFLNSIGVEAPRFAVLEADGIAFGVYKKPEGNPLGNYPVSDAEWGPCVDQVAGLLRRLHGVPLADACRALGLPDLEAKEAALKYRLGHDWFIADAFERALVAELGEDAELQAVWEETRQGMAAYLSSPRDLVFGHGDLWLDHTLWVKTPDGYRLSGVTGLWNAGLVNLYDEFLRVGSLGLYIGEGDRVGRAIIEAYHRLPGQTRRVEEVPLRHAIAAFWFYLAHESAGENKPKFLENAKRTQRGR